MYVSGWAHTVDSSRLALASLGGCEAGAQSESSSGAIELGQSGGPSGSEVGCAARIFGGIDAPGRRVDNDWCNV